MGEVAMTVQEVLTILITRRQIVLIVLGVFPLFTFFLSFLHGVYDARKTPWRQLYSLIIYLTTIFVTALAASMLYSYLNGVDPLPVTGIFLPVLVLVSWILTALFVKRVVDLEYLPGIPRFIPFILELMLIWSAGFFVYWNEMWFVFDDMTLSLLVTCAIAFIVLHSIFMAATRRSRQ